MRAEPKVPLLPCPFCGNDQLYAGHAESLVMEVACTDIPRRGRGRGRAVKGCGARVRVAKPVKWPKDLPTEDTWVAEDAINAIAQWTLDEAVRRWNTRQPGPEVPRRE